MIATEPSVHMSMDKDSWPSMGLLQLTNWGKYRSSFFLADHSRVSLHLDVNTLETCGHCNNWLKSVTTQFLPLFAGPCSCLESCFHLQVKVVQELKGNEGQREPGCEDFSVLPSFTDPCCSWEQGETWTLTSPKWDNCGRRQAKASGDKSMCRMPQCTCEEEAGAGKREEKEIATWINK